MDRIWKEGTRHYNADVTFRIVPNTNEKWQAHGDLSESFCS